MDQVKKAEGRNKPGPLLAMASGPSLEPQTSAAASHSAPKAAAKISTHAMQNSAAQAWLALNHIGSQGPRSAACARTCIQQPYKPSTKRQFLNHIKELQWITQLIGEKMWISDDGLRARSARYPAPEQALMHTMWKADPLAQYPGSIDNIARSQNITQ
ncbi:MULTISPECIES: hypothetical protein [Comamonas]|jgi:hypothetical protein|uniref:hypothetical protein n=1 Tax=Comamonas TaxID=283 RepID=UPI001057634C|nr:MULTISPECIES: hypothetical protein [Comamonas]